MSKWLLRGLVFAALMVIVRLLQGAMINAWETKAAIISITLVVLYTIVALLWGYADGRSDAIRSDANLFATVSNASARVRQLGRGGDWGQCSFFPGWIVEDEESSWNVQPGLFLGVVQGTPHTIVGCRGEDGLGYSFTSASRTPPAEQPSHPLVAAPLVPLFVLS